MRIPVLTYHSNNVNGVDYANNDHLALAEDLIALSSDGWQIVPLEAVAAWAIGGVELKVQGRPLALSFDDGSWFDYYDLEHPTWGPQPSFFNILKAFGASSSGAMQSSLHASSFVISSPDARRELDQKGLVGRGWWGDGWWLEAQTSDLLSIQCHSWDHVHPDLDQVAQRDQVKGDFSQVSTWADCDAQVRQAGDYICQRLAGHRPALFAYPWGQASAYILQEYFPRHGEQHGFKAAFTTEAKAVERGMNRWALPRFVCGPDWQSSEGLLELLNSRC